MRVSVQYTLTPDGVTTLVNATVHPGAVPLPEFAVDAGDDESVAEVVREVVRQWLQQNHHKLAWHLMN